MHMYKENIVLKASKKARGWGSLQKIFQKNVRLDFKRGEKEGEIKLTAYSKMFANRVMSAFLHLKVQFFKGYLLTFIT